MARPSLYECYSGLTDYSQEKKLVLSQPIVTSRSGIDTCPMLPEPINGWFTSQQICPATLKRAQESGRYCD